MPESLSSTLRQARSAFSLKRFKRTDLKRSWAATSGSLQRYSGLCQRSRKRSSDSKMLPRAPAPSSPLSSNKKRVVAHEGSKPRDSRPAENSSQVMRPLRSSSRARKAACKLPNFSTHHCLKWAKSNACSGTNSVKVTMPVRSLSKTFQSSSRSPSYFSAFKFKMNSCFRKVMLPSRSNFCQRVTGWPCFASTHSKNMLSSGCISDSTERPKPDFVFRRTLDQPDRIDRMVSPSSPS
mmetsp:Transcript_44484/g.127481  ORF Transcript_44484/g.127481 Transcript_44484/m.127481 type:complete len:237 (+) Transcript_44484:470-1180(+)